VTAPSAAVPVHEITAEREDDAESALDILLDAALDPIVDMVLLARDGDTGGPLIVFNKVPEPKIVKNRLHLDLISDTFDAETERLLSLGAQRLRDLQADKSRWTTFADIEGNEFDLIAR